MSATKIELPTECALTYYNAGLTPIALVQNQKRPEGNGWQHQTRENCMERIKPDNNLGLLAGNAGDLTVWDVDTMHKVMGKYVTCQEAVEFHDLTTTKFKKELRVTPEATTVSGGFHYAFKYTPELKSGVLKYKDVAIGEIVNDGKQIAVYPTKAYSAKLDKVGEYSKFDFSLADRKPMTKELVEWFNEHLTSSSPKSVEKKTKVVTMKVKNTMKKFKKIKQEKEVRELLEILDPDMDYSGWVNVGIDLHGISEDAFYLWDEWSAKGSKYTCTSDLYAKWVRFESDGTGIGNLHKKCRSVNVEKYSQVINGNLYQYVLKNHTRGMLGLVDIYNKKWGEDVQVVGVKNVQIYMYCDACGLWAIKPEFCLKGHFCTSLETLLDEVLIWVTKKKMATDDDDRLAKYQKSIGKCIERVRCGAGREVLNLLKDSNYNPDFIKLLNKKKNVLSVKNGLINLETGELRDRVREDYLTFTTNSVYDPTLNVDGVEKWISDMMLNKPDLVAYLKVMLGYGITGEVTEQILPIFMGSGGNGKGVLLRALFNVLGKDLFSNVEQSVLMKSNKSSAGQASPQLAQLDGARIACLTETDANEQLSEGLVKQLTGGDSFACRPLYSDIIEVTPQFLAIIQTNNPPTLRMDDAVRRRPIVFPFLAEFKSVSKYDPQNPRHILADANIDDTVDAMRDNFLTWLVQGAVEWYRTKNLKDTKPRDVAVHTDQYLDGQDVVMQFLTYCEISDADGKAYPRKKTDGGDGNPFTVKTALYSEFCGQNDSGQSIKRTEFYSLMSKRGFDSVPLSTATGQYKKGTRVYWGIKIPETENAWDL